MLWSHLILQEKILTWTLGYKDEQRDEKQHGVLGMNNAVKSGCQSNGNQIKQKLQKNHRWE